MGVVQSIGLIVRLADKDFSERSVQCARVRQRCLCSSRLTGAVSESSGRRNAVVRRNGSIGREFRGRAIDLYAL